MPALHFSGWWDGPNQSKAAELVRSIVEAAPLHRPRMPSGRPMRVKITSAGARAWWSDEHGGYRYLHTQPDGEPLPLAPQWLLDEGVRAAAEAGVDFCPDAVLVNWFETGAALGNHRDESEPDKRSPIVSFSLGDPALFLVRGLERDSAVMKRTVLDSGDCFVLSGDERNSYHEVQRIYDGSPIFPSPLHAPGRVSILVRKVT